MKNFQQDKKYFLVSLSSIVPVGIYYFAILIMTENRLMCQKNNVFNDKVFYLCQPTQMCLNSSKRVLEKIIFFLKLKTLLIRLVIQV